MDMNGRYVLYGVIPSLHADDNSDLADDTAQAQKIADTIPLFWTDDKDEAMKVYKAGGFERNGTWLAVTWGKDTETGGTIGAAPEEAQADG